MMALLRSAHAALYLVAFLMIAAPAAFAQGASGIITGMVADETGAMLPGATVTIRNEDTGATRELITGEGGRFRAVDLSPGPYVVTAAMTGFGSVAHRGITLTVGREAVVDFVLKVGQLNDVVNVVGEISTVDTQTVLDRRPDQRGADQEPAAQRPQLHRAGEPHAGRPADQPGRTHRRAPASARRSASTDPVTPQNLFTLDGTMMNDQFNQAGSASGNMLGVEAVREFQVLTNSFSAEYRPSHRSGDQRGDQDRHQRLPRVGVRVPS